MLRLGIFDMSDLSKGSSPDKIAIAASIEEEKFNTLEEVLRHLFEHHQGDKNWFIIIGELSEQIALCKFVGPNLFVDDYIEGVDKLYNQQLEVIKEIP